jgi:hypothetical protein
MARPKTQQTTSPGHDTLLSGTSAYRSTSSRGIVLISDKSTAKSALTEHNSVLSGKKTEKASSAGHDRGVSTRNNTGSGELHNSCISTAHQPVHATQKPAGSSSLRWRVSTSSWVSHVSPKGTDTRPTCSANHAPLDVLRPKSAHAAGNPAVPGTVAASLGMRSTGHHVSGQNHKRVPDGLAKQLAVLSGLQLVPKDLLVSPSRRGSPDFYADRSSDTGVKSPQLLVRSAAICVGNLLYNAASAFAGAWQSSLALASGPEDLLFNMLSSSGRKLMLAKKRLHLVGLRIAFSGVML